MFLCGLEKTIRMCLEIDRTQVNSFIKTIPKFRNSIMEIDKILSELQFKAVRSSGAGGQNVNKVSSKVVLSFDLKASQALSEEEKILLETKLALRLTNDQILILNCDEDRSQLKNKGIVIKRFLKLIQEALIIPKKRKPTKIPKSVIKKRIKDKKNLSDIKQSRRKPDLG
jgi:ribosome-associated protein